MNGMEHSPFFWIFNVIVVAIVSALTLYSARTRKGAGGFLCEDCKFNDPVSCLKSDRPEAMVCTSYRPNTLVKTQTKIKSADTAAEI